MPIPIKNGLSYPKTKIIYGDTRNKIQNQSSVPPIDFHAKTGLAVEYSIDGNMTQASTQEYSITDIPPIDFQSDGNGISDYSIYGNMVQASSQQYSLTGVSPLSFKSDANMLSAWSINGNGQQSGTPTPDNIVMPQFVGVRTAQLFDGQIFTTAYPNYATFNAGIVNVTNLVGAMYTPGITVDIEGTTTAFLEPIARDNCSRKGRVRFVFDDDSVLEMNVTDENGAPVAASYNTFAKTIKSIRLNWVGVSTSGFAFRLTIVSGTTAPTTYIPYGYQLPITCSGQTTPVYLGEVPTVRKIKKLVFTGEESPTFYNKNNTSSDNSLYYIRFNALQSVPLNGSTMYCTHLQYLNYTPSQKVGINIGSTYSVIYFNFGLDVMNAQSSGNTVEGLIEYITAQYAAGTPVTIWYVLKTQETAIINEPLCKIGDYADELSSADAGITITTTSGDNTLSIDTTLSPSSVSITTTSGVWPENPIIPEETGDLVESGEHAGQYTIPITNAGTTTNIYALEPLRKIGDYADVIGSNGTVTRNVKKLVLTGQETWSNVIGSGTESRVFISLESASIGMCTHYVSGSAQNVGEFDLASGIYLRFNVSGVATNRTEWETYLAAQYAAGTPVCVWYVLATPTTETITSPTITTVSGSNTLSIGTTLQPSNVSLTTSSSVYPLNPIIPEEVGDKTGNLFDKSAAENGKWLNVNTGAEENTSDFYWLSDYIPVVSGQSYTFTNPNSARRWFYDTSKVPVEKIEASATYTPASNGFVRFTITKEVVDSFMLNTGGTALPYEPFGYKIPLNINNTISNIYLSQPIRKIGNYSDSIDYENRTVTRQIKKLVLTGQETFGSYINPPLQRYGVYLRAADMRVNMGLLGYSTHFQPVTMPSPEVNGIVFGFSNDFLYFLFSSDTATSLNLTTLDNIKEWFQQQYENGNPVCVWYILSTPEVEQITPPTITPSIESNTISVDTSLQPSNLSITYTSPDYSLITKVYDNLGNLVYRDPFYYDWETIRDVVRKGLAPQYYPIGTVFYDNFNPTTGTAFQVVAYDNHFDPALTAQGYTHSMTLCEVLIDGVITFDAIEAFLYTNQALPAGTYKFTIPNYDTSYGGNKTYYFTSTSELPANSQIVMNWPYNQTPKTVTGYAPTASLTAMENTTAATGWSALTLTEWVDGTSPTATDLGTIAGPTTQAGSSSYGQMNHIHRARYGSNNYLQSGVRQYINSNSAGGQWWQPQTIFDRPYGSRSSNGKLKKLNQDLVDVMAYPAIKSRTNSYFETNSLDGTILTTSTDYDIITDRMFLLSPVEVGFSTTDTTIGTLLDYYINATNETRIKKRKSNNTAYYWWLRMPYPSSAYGVRLVHSSGALYTNLASSSYGSAAACVIQ